jgi:uncharacterized membrane protein HdeD (DUF308 family)
VSLVDGTRSALIVASYDYQDPGLRRLRAPAQDAEALARVLRDPSIGDFDVRTMLNEPSYVVNEAVEEFFDERGRDDLLLLHFSCHGVKDEGGELYFATANTKLRRLGATAVAADFVNRRMNRSRSRRVVLLLDCCYAGAFERGIVARAGAGVDIEEQFGGRGRAVITASSAMEYAFEGDQLADTQALQPSVFTSALVQGLETGEADRDQDGMVDLDELYDYVYEKVRAVTPNQTPGKWTFAVQGELYIARRSKPVTTPAALPPELQQVIDHPIPGVRASAVQELERLLEGRHAGLALAAKLALEQLVEDDSRMVSAAATAALGSQFEANVPAARPPSLPPGVVPRSLPTSTRSEIPSVTEKGDSGPLPGPAATSAQPSIPPKPSEPTSTNSVQTSRNHASQTGSPTVSVSDPTTTDRAKAPDPREHKPAVGRAVSPSATADHLIGARPSPSQATLAGIGRRWGSVLGFGIITLLTAILVLIWPGRTPLVLARLFGIQLVAAGILRLAVALASDDESSTSRVPLTLLGALSFIVGLYALLNLQVTTYGLTIELTVVLGIFWIINGAVEIFVARSQRAMPDRGWAIVMGLLGIVAGVALLVHTVSLLTLVVVLGSLLLLLGIIEIILAFRLRSVAKRRSRAATST